MFGNIYSTIVDHNYTLRLDRVLRKITLESVISNILVSLYIRYLSSPLP
uniref:Uncharacterized protein n=1 Tax=Myoviridae sp. ctqMr7 TaxID=2823552 RepID=A0A8S5LHY9_9CAUD|nr:MAG TPA: hypothetical protein [Myoviridae sp. ctqMr7]